MSKEIDQPLVEQEEARRIFGDTEKTSYTKYPHKYTRKIRLNLKSCQSSICDFVIERTYGYHKPFAEITLDDFVKNCIKPGKKNGYGQRQIVNAKNDVLKSGLLIKIKNPKGSAHKGLYAINIFFDNPKPIPEPSIIESVQSPFEPEADQALVYNYVENPVENPILEAQETLVTQSEMQESEISVEQAESSVQQAEILQDFAEPESAHYIDNNNLSISKTFKTNKTNPKSVCFDFCQKFGFDANSVYKTFNMLAESYGLDYLIEKIRLVYDFAKNHKIASPMGFLRSACQQNYNLPRPLRQKLEASQKAEYEVRKRERENAEMIRIVQENEQRQLKITLAKERLVDGKFAEYIEKAKLAFVSVPWLVEPAVLAEAHRLLLIDFNLGFVK